MLEAIASVWAMGHFKHYLRHEFTLRTDNVVLGWLKNKSDKLGSMAKWVMLSQEYRYVVEHVSGRLFYGPDLMSRAGAKHCSIDKRLVDIDKLTFHASKSLLGSDIPSDVKLLDRSAWVNGQKECDFVQKMVKNNEFFVKDQGLWYHVFRERRRVVVPLSLRNTILHISHGLHGHRGVKPTASLLARLLYWPKMRPYLAAWIRSCCDCCRKKMRPLRNVGFGCPILIRHPFEELHIDYIGSFLPVTKDGFQYCLTAVCPFTRFPFAIPLRSKDFRELGDVLLRDVFSVFGFPKRIRSDNDTSFVSEAMTYLFRRFGIQHILIVRNRPEQNGHVERLHRYMNSCLAIILPKYNQWDRMLPVVLLAYRGFVHETTSYSPHEMVFGRDMRLPLEISFSTGASSDLYTDFEEEDQYSVYVDSQINKMQAIFTSIRKSQLAASAANQARREGNNVPATFKRNDLVFWHEPKRVGQVQGRMRVAPVKSGEFAPIKWRFKWSGPHRFIKNLGSSKLHGLVEERGTGRIAKAQFTDLRHHYPFSRDILDTSTPSAYTPPVLPLAPGCNRHSPRSGDLCLFYQPDNADTQEVFCVLEYKGKDSFQWYSSYEATRIGAKLQESNLQKLKSTVWLPGWTNSNDDLITYAAKRPNGKCLPFSADRFADKLDFMIASGFALTKDKKIGSELLDWVEKRMELYFINQTALGFLPPNEFSAPDEWKI
jgi:hypothetical protein